LIQDSTLASKFIHDKNGDEEQPPGTKEKQDI
jgi:hypothetical protein